MRTSTETLIAAMHILATEIQSDDGAANAVVAEAGERLAEQHMRIKRLEEAGNNLLWNFCPEYTSDLTQEQSDALKQWNKAKEAKP